MGDSKIGRFRAGTRGSGGLEAAVRTFFLLLLPITTELVGKVLNHRPTSPGETYDRIDESERGC